MNMFGFDSSAARPVQRVNGLVTKDKPSLIVAGWNDGSFQDCLGSESCTSYILSEACFPLSRLSSLCEDMDAK